MIYVLNLVDENPSITLSMTNGMDCMCNKGLIWSHMVSILYVYSRVLFECCQNYGINTCRYIQAIN